MRYSSNAQHVVILNNFVNVIASSIKYFAGKAGYNENIDEQVYKDIVWTGLDDMPEFITAVPNITDRTRIKNRIKAESTGQPFGGIYPVGNKLSLRCN